ncbi:MAG: hypothetical protein K0R34_2758 [Herbinix sp.]|jgi:hypothetical protein|nr:hypothetical protein [Herbinix sp.]
MYFPPRLDGEYILFIYFVVDIGMIIRYTFKNLKNLWGVEVRAFTP